MRFFPALEMRWIVVLFGVIAICAAFPQLSVNLSELHNSAIQLTKETVLSTNDDKCISGFAYNSGWCIHRSDARYTYQQAVDVCSSMGLFAPSIHSDSDLDFWKDVAASGTFWLDAYCPKSGQPYAWMDATPTDYYGPNFELAYCRQEWGFQMRDFGLDDWPLGQPTQALCVYNVNHSPSTLSPTTSTTPEPALSNTEPYCACDVDKFGLPDGWNPAEIWLDIVVVLDTSLAMGQEQLEDAEILIESLLGDGATDFLTTDSQAKFFTRFGVISMPDNKVLYDLNMTSSDKMQGKTKINTLTDMINIQTGFESAKSMLDNGLKDHPERANVHQVVYFMTASNRYSSPSSMNDFKSKQGIIIVNEFVKPGNSPISYLKSTIASDGYYYMNSNNLEGLQAFCKANCFCGDPNMIINGKTASGGCFHSSLSGVPFNKAKSACSALHGFVATAHNEEKGRFLQKLLTTSKSGYFWIGYEKSDNGNWQWEDQSSDPYTNWGENEPSNQSVAKCAYIDTSNAALPWGAGNCQVGFPYVCQSAPCSTGYMDCR